MPFWVMGEFGSGKEALHAVRGLKEEGHAKLDVCSPFPIEGMAHELGLRRSWIRIPTLVFSIAAAAFAFWIQWYSAAGGYPLNVGDRPLLSWPAFIPDTYETLILVAAFSAFFALLAATRLPKLHHPTFRVERFQSATVDGFWVNVVATTEKQRDDAFRLLRRFGARELAVLETEEA